MTVATISTERPPTLGLGILSWQAHRTLTAALECMAREKFFSLFDETLLFFQQLSDRDRTIAAAYRLPCAGDPQNLGILGGFREIARRLDTDYVLCLENDWQLVEDYRTAERLLSTALTNMHNGQAHCYHLEVRHTDDFKYLRYHPPAPGQDTLARRLRRLLRPGKAQRLAGRAIYASVHPEQIFPQWIRRLGEEDYVVDSAVFNWCNACPLYRRRWFLDEIIPFAEAHPSSRTVNGKPDLEKELNCQWWRDHHYQIGFSKGLFVHQRLDRPAHDEKAKH